jgi:hypothetical protein
LSSLDEENNTTPHRHSAPNFWLNVPLTTPGLTGPTTQTRQVAPSKNDDIDEIVHGTSMANNSDDAIDILDKCARYRFQEHDFLPQWKAIQKFVKYRSIGDYTYGNRRRFTSARHLQECLDRVAIPTLRSIFQPDDDDDAAAEDGNDDDENDDDLIELRRLVCAEIEDVIEATLANATMEDDKVDDDEHDNEAPHDESHWNADKDIACATKRGRRAEKADYGRSAISYDAGTDQYLKRKNKNKKQRTVVAVGTAAASMSNDNNKEAAHVVASSLKETVAHAKALDTSECEKIEAAYATSEFDRWKFLLYTNHALILYGNGSKRTIVNTFCDNELQSDGGILQVDAIDVNVSAASIIALLANLFRCRDFESSSATRSFSLIAQADQVGKQIHSCCQEGHDAVFLVIYNLECILQRHPSDWKVIEKLAEHVRLLATVDDVDAPSYMSPCCTSCVWIAVHTQRPYVRELAKLEGSDEEQSRQSIRARQRELSESRIFEVLRNLAPRYAQVMEVLAQLQLQVRVVVDRTTAAAAANDDTGWVNYKDFREACKSNCLTDKQLRTLQTELKEHGLMVDKIDATGEYVRIPFGVEKLQAIQNFKGTLPKKTS